MKVLLTMISSASLSISSLSYITACNGVQFRTPGIPDSAIGPPLEEEPNYFQWLGEYIVEGLFDAEAAARLRVNSDRKVIVDNVSSDLVQDLNKQSWVSGGYLYEVVYNQLRQVYGINILNQVGRYEDFNIFEIDRIDESGNKLRDEFVLNDYGWSVKSGTYEVVSQDSSSRISGSFKFELKLRT